MSRRDGVFKKNGWWWIDYADADGKRHRQKAAPSHEVAKLVYRDKMIAIAKGEVTGVREEGMRLRDFVDKRYWPTVGPKLSRWEHQRDPRAARDALPQTTTLTPSKCVSWSIVECRWGTHGSRHATRRADAARL